MDEQAKLVLEILDGKIPPLNDTVAYIVKRANELKEEGSQLLPYLQELEGKASAVKRKLVEINGSIQNYQEDIRRLLETETKAKCDQFEYKGPKTQFNQPLATEEE